MLPHRSGGEDIAELDRDHRAHAHVEQRIEDFKALGLAKLPFRSFAMNEAWMQLVLAAQDVFGFAKALTLAGELAKAKPHTLRYRLLHQAGRLARSGRRTRLRLASHWPWAEDWSRPVASSTPCRCPRGKPARPGGETRRGRAVLCCADRLYVASITAETGSRRFSGATSRSHSGADTAVHPRRSRSGQLSRACCKIWASGEDDAETEAVLETRVSLEVWSADEAEPEDRGASQLRLAGLGTAPVSLASALARRDQVSLQSAVAVAWITEVTPFQGSGAFTVPPIPDAWLPSVAYDADDVEALAAWVVRVEAANLLACRDRRGEAAAGSAGRSSRPASR